MDRRHLFALAVSGIAAVGAPARLAGQGEEREGATIYFVEGPEEFDAYGRNFAVLGDVDGDGVKDFATSGRAPGTVLPAPAPFCGHVDLLSGRTGALLRRWFGDRQRGDLGKAIGALPDIDGDGVAELGAEMSGGELRVLSPVTGERWYTVPEFGVQSTFGQVGFLNFPDRDGDGVGEFVYVNGEAQLDFRNDGYVAGRVTLHSGRTGEVLWEHMNDLSQGSLLHHVAPAGDMDGDGHGDILITGGEASTRNEVGHPLFLLGGRTGEVLDVIHLRDDMRSWGNGLVSLGDHDGNGFPELLVAAPLHGVHRPDDETGWVGLYHLPDFRLIWSHVGRRGDTHTRLFPDALGAPIAAAGDVDGDGAVDALVGTSRQCPPDRPTFSPFHYSRLYVHSGRTGEVLLVYEADYNLLDDRPGPVVFAAGVFQDFSALDDIDGDGRLDFVTGRSSITSELAFGLGIVRTLRYRPEGPRFRRGDANGDGRVDVADAAVLIRSLAAGRPLPCEIAGDVNATGGVDTADAVYLLHALFIRASEEPAAPYPECGRYDVAHRWVRLGCRDPGSCGDP